jgi:hypothetical protein
MKVFYVETEEVHFIPEFLKHLLKTLQDKYIHEYYSYIALKRMLV